MIKNKKTLQYGLVLLGVLTFLFIAGCGKKADTGKPSSEANSSPGILEQILEPEPPKLASELFAEGLRKSLVEAIDKSAKMRTISFDMLLNPRVQADNRLQGHTEFNILLTNDEEPNETASISSKSDVDKKTGDASMTISMKGGGETVTTGGIYFFDQYLLVQKGDVEKPMIQYEMDPSVADSYQSLHALERFMRLLSEPTKPKMSESEWISAIDTYLETVSAKAEEEHYVSEEQNTTFAGIEETCTVITLTLSGQNAADTVRGLVELISLDPTFKALFVSHYQTDEDTYGVTGMDGLLRDLDALTADEIDAMDLTFRTLQGDNSSGLYMNTAVGEKSASLLLRFFELDHARQVDMNFSGFEDGGVKLNEMNTPEGGDNYSGQMIYEDISPGGETYESTKMMTKNTVAGDNYTAKLEFAYNMAGDGEKDPLDISGNYDYSQIKSGQSITGELIGSSVIKNGDEPQSFGVSITTNQGEGTDAISVPQFIEGSGISTSDPTALYEALAEQLNQERYNNVPPSMKLMLTLLSILI